MATCVDGPADPTGAVGAPPPLEAGSGERRLLGRGPPHLELRRGTFLVCRLEVDEADPDLLQAGAEALFDAAMEATAAHYAMLQSFETDVATLSWNICNSQPAHELHACRCAWQMERSMLARGQRCRLVVHTAEFLVGPLGTPGRGLVSLHGRELHVAHRLLQLHGMYDGSLPNILLTAATATAVGRGLGVVPVECAWPEGARRSTLLYGLLRPAPFTVADVSYQLYYAGFEALLGGRFKEAGQYFADCGSELRVDAELRPHAHRLQQLAKDLLRGAGAGVCRRDGWDQDWGTRPSVSSPRRLGGSPSSSRHLLEQLRAVSCAYDVCATQSTGPAHPSAMSPLARRCTSFKRLSAEVHGARDSSPFSSLSPKRGAHSAAAGGPGGREPPSGSLVQLSFVRRFGASPDRPPPGRLASPGPRPPAPDAAAAASLVLRPVGSAGDGTASVIIQRTDSPATMSWPMVSGSDGRFSSDLSSLASAVAHITRASSNSGGTIASHEPSAAPFGRRSPSAPVPVPAPVPTDSLTPCPCDKLPTDDASPAALGPLPAPPAVPAPGTAAADAEPAAVPPSLLLSPQPAPREHSDTGTATSSAPATGAPTAGIPIHRARRVTRFLEDPSSVTAGLGSGGSGSAGSGDGRQDSAQSLVEMPLPSFTPPEGSWESAESDNYATALAGQTDCMSTDTGPQRPQARVGHGFLAYEGRRPPAFPQSTLPLPRIAMADGDTATHICSGSPTGRLLSPNSPTRLHGAGQPDSPSGSSCLAISRHVSPYREMSMLPDGRIMSEEQWWASLSTAVTSDATQFSVGNARPVDTVNPEGTPQLWYCSSKVLGSGGFGDVYLGMSESGMLVALKQMEVEPEKKPQLMNEIKLLWKFQHPNIVRYYGSGIVSGFVMVVMEYACTSLASVLCSFGCLSAVVCRSYTRDIAQGLQYLHDQGVIHRDVKPENVLMNQSGTCKLADFGTAVILGRRFQSTGFITGTPHYMAPELLRGELGKEVDIWALGVTLWRMLLGRPLVDSLTVNAIFYTVGTMTEPPEIPDDLPEEARDFLQHCLQLPPEDRWTVKQLLASPFLTA